MIKPIDEELSSIAKCEVTLYLRVDPKGHIPATLIKFKISSALSIICGLRMQFQQDEAVDLEQRNKLAAVMIGGRLGPHHEEEEAMQQEDREKFEAIDRQEGGMKALESPDFLAMAWAGHQVGERSIIGKSETIVDAPFGVVAAWDYSVGSRYHSANFFGSRAGKERTVYPVERSNHSQIVRQVTDLQVLGFEPRESTIACFGS